MRVISVLAAIMATAVWFSDAKAQKFPSCVGADPQARTKIAVSQYVSRLMEESCRESSCRQKSEIVDIQISIPYAEGAYPGPHAGVLKCSVTGVAILRTGNRTDRLPLQKVMVYYTYDQLGNLVVEAMPKQNP